MGIEKYIDSDLLDRFEFYNYGHALEILHDAFPVEWDELQECLRKLKLTWQISKKQVGMNRRYQRSLMMCYILTDGEKSE